MSYWIFKTSEQSTYPDIPGEAYVYDNTHSVRVKAGDEFLYLEKTGQKYGLTGAGKVAKVTCRKPGARERHSTRVEKVFTAHLADMVWFSGVFDLSSRSKVGVRNRRLTGLPDDLNTIGWSLSMARIERDLFIALLDAALGVGENVQMSPKNVDWRIEDSWSLVRSRCRLRSFRDVVLHRHSFTCAICGTRRRSVLEVAHIRRYAADRNQRANPANGICLCRFCHAAFDAGDVILHGNGQIVVLAEMGDDVSQAHFGGVPASVREAWLSGVDLHFLEERATAYVPIQRQ